jgi:hypothetical protein
MPTAAELRAEAACLRDFVDNVNDPAESAAIVAMIEELEGRAKVIDNGGAADNVQSDLRASSRTANSSESAADRCSIQSARRARESS